MTLAVELRSDVEGARVEKVKALAARIAMLAQGMEVREFLDASALAGGALIRNIYRGPGVNIALQRYQDALARAVRKGA